MKVLFAINQFDEIIFTRGVSSKHEQTRTRRFSILKISRDRPKLGSFVSQNVEIKNNFRSSNNFVVIGVKQSREMTSTRSRNTRLKRTDVN